MLDGLSKFLETVDKKAGEIVAAQRNAENEDDRLPHLDTEPSSFPAPPDRSVEAAAIISDFGGGGGAYHSTEASTAVRGATGKGLPAATQAWPAEQHHPSAVVSAPVGRTTVGNQRLQDDFDRAMERVRETNQQVVTLKEDLQCCQQERDRLVDDLATSVKQYTVSLVACQRLEDHVRDLEALLSDAQQSLAVQIADARSHEAARRQAEVASRAAQMELNDFREKVMLLLAEKDATLDRFQVQARSDENASRESAAGVPVAVVMASAPYRLLQERLAEAAEARKGDVSLQIAQLQASLDNTISECAKASSQSSALQEQLEQAKHNTLVTANMFDGEVAAHTRTRERLERVIEEKDQFIRALEKQRSSTTASSSSAHHAPADVTSSSSSSGSSGASDVAEWERRAKDLAELVMEKQAALEAKRSEADQWRTRCEIAQQRVREVELLSMSTRDAGSSGSGVGARLRHHTSLSMPITDDGATEGTFEDSRFFGKLSVRGTWGAKLSGVARGLDDLSLKSGGFLRRSSVLRVGLVLYVALLHLWVFAVLSMSSVPQSHAIKP